jgi:hypothetical protein
MADSPQIQHKTLRSRLLPAICAGLIAIASLPWAWAANPSPTAEIHVTLFGQPCVLSGPFDEPTLKAIHAISPEQVYPRSLDDDVKLVTSKEIKAALERLRKTNTLPPALDRYRELVGKRLEEMQPFFDGIEAARKTGSSDELIAGTKKFLADGSASAFAALARQFQSKRDPSLIEKLFEIYEPVIEPDPQEEFHRAIHRISVNYVCNYE